MATQPYDDGDWETIPAPSQPKKAQAPAVANDGDWETVSEVENPNTRSFGTRLADEFKGATATGFPGLLARKTYDWFNIGKQPGESEESHNARIAQAQREILAEAEAKAAADPSWRPDETWAQNLLSTRWPAAVLGGGAGSAGPEMLLNPGASAEARIASQAGISGASDLGYQALEKNAGVRDSISLGQAGMQALFGGGFQGLNEIGSALTKSIKGETPVKWENEEEFQNATRALLSDPTATRENFDQLAQQYGRDPFGSDLDEVLANRKGPVSVVTGQETPEGYHSSVESGKLAPAVQKIVNHLDAEKGQWTNAPNVKVEKNFNSIDSIDDSALGFFDPETGRVHLNADAINEEAVVRGLTPGQMTNTVMFHEGLGHYGLAQKFRDDLDFHLNTWIENSPFFRNKVDEWIKKNPNSYIDEDQHIRAGEEVLAEMSEKGRIPAKLMDRIKNTVKQYAREVGINLNFSERELRTILAQAHDAVVNGKKADVIGNGFRTMSRKAPRTPEEDEAVNAAITKIADEFQIKNIEKALTERDFRSMVKMELEQNGISQHVLDKEPSTPRYMKRSHGSSEGTLQGAGAAEEKTGVSPINKVRSNRNIEEILEENAPERVAESWDEWIDDAGKIKNAGQVAKNLSKGSEVPELLAAEEYATKSANRIFDLSHKASLSPREEYILLKEQERLANVLEGIMDVVSNAGRILNSRKIEVGSDKALSDQMRRMLVNADLSTPEKRMAFAKKFAGTQQREKVMKKALDVFNNVINLPRAIMSSIDFSAPFRQGVFLVGRKEFWKNIPDMFKYAFNKKFFEDMEDSLRSRPTYPLMEKAGLSLTEHGTNLSKREEQFMSTWAEKIPFLGHAVKGSERAYSGFLNKVRADTFDNITKLYDDAGINLKTDKKALKDIAKFINNATGRGDLGKFNQAAPTLAGLLFSPRLVASRLRMLYPGTYIGLDPIVRKEALKAALSFGAIASTGVAMLGMAGADVELDPTSSDFMKAKFGNKRYDLFGGFQQYIVLASRLAYNQKKNAAGEIVNLGEKFGSDDAWDVLGNFVRSKLSPNASFVVNARTGKNIVGEEFETKNAVAEMFIPMFLKDLGEMIAEDGAIGALEAAPAMFGIGVQNYETKSNDKEEAVSDDDTSDEWETIS